MYCQKCGNRLPDDAVFCSKCGAKVVKSSPPPTPPVADTHSESIAKKWLKGIIWHTLKFFIGLIIAMIIPTLLYIIFPHFAGAKIANTVYVLRITIQCIGYVAIPFLFSLPLLIGLSKLVNTSCFVEGFFVLVFLREIDWFIFNEQFAETMLIATTLGALIVGLVLGLLLFVRYKKN